jgi:endonuclease-3
MVKRPSGARIGKNIESEKKTRASAVHALLEQAFGEPKPAAAHEDTVESLVLTILSQSTTDANSERAFESLKRDFSGRNGGVDWQKVAAAPVEKLAGSIRSGGLANQKSERIQRILAWIKEEFGGYDIDSICETDPLETIRMFTKQKGIGVKTIAVVLSFSCGADIFPVDVHVHRVCRRIGLVDEKASAEKTFWKMRDVVPRGKAFSLHMNMIRLGRTVCRPKNPACPDCPANARCDYFRAQ